MTNSRAILLGMGMIAGAILVVGLSTSLKAQAVGTVGLWQIFGTNPAAYKINTQTGEVWICAAATLRCQRTPDQS
jgi:hypothetical protein